MKVETLKINGKLIINAMGEVDWNLVKGFPSTSSTSNNHNHNDRYYTKSEINERFNSLDHALNLLQIKVENF